MKNRKNETDEEERFIAPKKQSEFGPDADTDEFPKEIGLVDFPERETDPIETEPVDFPKKNPETSDPETSILEKEILNENGFSAFTDDELDGVYEELEQVPGDIETSPEELELTESVISAFEQKISETERFSSFSETDKADVSVKSGKEKKETAFEQIDPSEIGLAEFEDNSDDDDGFTPFTDSGTNFEANKNSEGDFIDFSDHPDDRVAEAWEKPDKPKPDDAPKSGNRKPEKINYLKIALLSVLFPVLVVSILILLENQGYVTLPIHVEISKFAGTSDADRKVRQPDVSKPAPSAVKKPATSNAKKPEKIVPKTDSPEPDPIHEKLLAINEIISGISSKRDEIAALISQYQDGIEVIRAEIMDEAQKTGGVSFRHVSENKKITLGLASVRRRMAYITELERMSGDLLFAAEELLYIRRITEIDMTIVDFAEGVDMKMIRTRLDGAIDKNFGKAESLVFEVATDETDTLESVWDRLFGKKMADSGKKGAPASVEQEIISGEYDRKCELAELTPTTAQHLAKWDGKCLYLGGISNLTPDAAKNLAEWKGDWLILNGLDSLSPETAEHLFRWKGNRLSLNGISKMSRKTVRYMARWEGKNLELASLTDISEKNPDFSELKKWEASGGKLYVSDALRSRLDGVARPSGK